MRITAIDFSDVRFDAATGKARALCTLHSAESSTQLMVRATLPDLTDPSEYNESALRPALFADAVRQMTRMPEFRNGLRQLAWGDELPADLRAAAA